MGETVNAAYGQPWEFIESQKEKPLPLFLPTTSFWDFQIRYTPFLTVLCRTVAYYDLLYWVYHYTLSPLPKKFKIHWCRASFPLGEEILITNVFISSYYWFYIWTEPIGSKHTFIQTTANPIIMHQISKELNASQRWFIFGQLTDIFIIWFSSLVHM